MNALAAPELCIGWRGIFRLGLVQTALGSIVVLTTSTLNRVIVVELALPALLPGLLVGIHYTVQLLRPKFGHGADIGGRKTPWIIGGMALLALGGSLAGFSTVLLATQLLAGTLLAMLSFLMIGMGVGASGTALLVLLSDTVRADRRAAAASVTWLMMIAGFAITAGIAGSFLDPYSHGRLLAVMTTVSVLAFLLACTAVLGVERRGRQERSQGERSQGRFQAPELDPHASRETGTDPLGRASAGHAAGATDGPDAVRAPSLPFRQALAEVWSEPEARRFSIFIFVSMLAFSAQDLILEPFAGAVFGYTPGQSTQLAGLQHGGVLVGMILVGICSRGRQRASGLLRGWVVAGCLGAALVLFVLAFGGLVGPAWPLDLTVFTLGVTVGAFSVAAIGSMMGMVKRGNPGREGVRMGLWGAAQGVAFGLGALTGTAAVDTMRALVASPAAAYGMVFVAEGLLFLLSAWLVIWVERAPRAAMARVPAIAPRSAVAQ